MQLPSVFIGFRTFYRENCNRCENMGVKSYINICIGSSCRHSLFSLFQCVHNEPAMTTGIRSTFEGNPHAPDNLIWPNLVSWKMYLIDQSISTYVQTWKYHNLKLCTVTAKLQFYQIDTTYEYYSYYVNFFISGKKSHLGEIQTNRKKLDFSIKCVFFSWALRLHSSLTWFVGFI